MNRYQIDSLLSKGGQAYIYRVRRKNTSSQTRREMEQQQQEEYDDNEEQSSSYNQQSEHVSGSEGASFPSSEESSSFQSVNTDPNSPNASIQQDREEKNATSSPPTMAMKRLLVENIDEANEALRELLILSNLSHRHMIKYTDLFIDTSESATSVGASMTSVCLIMKLYENGDLDSFIRRHYEKYQHLDECFVLEFLSQILSCVTHLHENGVIHRDIKPLNILVDQYTQQELEQLESQRAWMKVHPSRRDHSDSSTAESDLLAINHQYDGVKLVLTDFGLSTSFSAKSLKSTFCGSLNYISPSLIRRKYSSSVDIWALGCVLYYLLTGQERIMYMDFLQDPDGTRREISEELQQRGYSELMIQLLFGMLRDDGTGSNSVTAQDVETLLQQAKSGIIEDAGVKATLDSSDDLFTNDDDMMFDPMQQSSYSPSIYSRNKAFKGPQYTSLQPTNRKSNVRSKQKKSKGNSITKLFKKKKRASSPEFISIPQQQQQQRKFAPSPIPAPIQKNIDNIDNMQIALSLNEKMQQQQQQQQQVVMNPKLRKKSSTSTRLTSGRTKGRISGRKK